ncbi:MAG: hypothetical protein WAL71_13160 [Terriglobales bacterium]|jgi:hypothetical protein
MGQHEVIAQELIGGSTFHVREVLQQFAGAADEIIASEMAPAIA